MIAHELNNILTPVLSYAQLALSRPGDRALAERALTRAVAGVESAAKVTAAILAFAREDDGGEGAGGRPDAAGGPCDGEGAGDTSNHNSKAADVAAVAEEVLESLGDRLRGCEVEVNVGGGRGGAKARSRCGDEAGVKGGAPGGGAGCYKIVGGGVRVRMDAVLLRQVLVNLVRNAAEAMVSGGRIGIAARGRGGWVRIVVEDDGPGIEPRVLERLFSPFVSGKGGGAGGRGSAAGEGGGGEAGTGLGLAIVKRIVESAGGRIEVASSGRGTRVEVRLARG